MRLTTDHPKGGWGLLGFEHGRGLGALRRQYLQIVELRGGVGVQADLAVVVRGVGDLGDLCSVDTGRDRLPGEAE
ncbi:hypothetical protein [Streptomyces sp. NPDC048419]|uniref:hypothetical protein n=1 Tax=Streptomyces sp. NPDC048419 TaxID=3365547 RepID=UPI00371EFD71